MVKKPKGGNYSIELGFRTTTKRKESKGQKMKKNYYGFESFTQSDPIGHHLMIQALSTAEETSSQKVWKQICDSLYFTFNARLFFPVTFTSSISKIRSLLAGMSLLGDFFAIRFMRRNDELSLATDLHAL